MNSVPSLILGLCAAALPSLCVAQTGRMAPMTIVDIAAMPIGSTPTGFTEALTGHGKPVRWQVLEDATAPGHVVIAETSRDIADYRFPLCIYDHVIAKDVEISVKFKPVAGSVDQAGGVIARVQDPLNYYVTRANALEDNVRLYKVVAGVRRQLAGQNVTVSPGNWHTLSLKIAGDLLEVTFDGTRVIQSRDSTFAGSGKVGIWTKADSLTHFADLNITASAPDK